MLQLKNGLRTEHVAFAAMMDQEKCKLELNQWKDNAFGYFARMSDEQKIEESKIVSDQILKDFGSVDDEDLEKCLCLFRLIATFGLRIPMQLVHVAWLGLNVSDSALRFLIDAIRSDRTLGYRITCDDLFRIDSFVSNFATLGAYLSPFWDLLNEFIDSSTECCDALLCYGLMDHIGQCTVRACATIEQMRRVLLTLIKIAKMMTSNLMFVQIIFSFCLDILISFLETQGFDETMDAEFFCYVIECCEALIVHHPKCIDEEMQHFIGKAFEVFNHGCYCERVLVALARLINGFLSLEPPVNHISNERLEEIISLLSQVNTEEARKELIEIMIKVLKREPKFIQLLKEKGLVERAKNSLLDGSVAEKFVSGRFFALLTDARFFESEKECFVEFQVLEEMSTLVMTMANNTDRKCFIQGLCKVAHYMQKNRVSKEYPLMKPFYDVRIRSLFRENGFSEDENVQKLRHILQSLDPSY